MKSEPMLLVHWGKLKVVLLDNQMADLTELWTVDVMVAMKAYHWAVKTAGLMVIWKVPRLVD